MNEMGANGFRGEMFADDAFDCVGFKWFATENIQVGIVCFLTEMGGDAAGFNQLDECVSALVSGSEPHDLWGTECNHFNVPDEMLCECSNASGTSDGLWNTSSDV